jgi:hypothetical protein
VLSRSRRSKNNDTGFIRSIYSDGLSLWNGKEGGDRHWKFFLASRAGACNIITWIFSPLCSWDYGSTITMIEQQHPVVTQVPHVSTNASLEALVIPNGCSLFSCLAPRISTPRFLLEIYSILPNGLGHATPETLAITSTSS